jgi:hypothetical protein
MFKLMFESAADRFGEGPRLVGAVGPGRKDNAGALVAGHGAGAAQEYLSCGLKAVAHVCRFGVCNRLYPVEGAGDEVDIAVFGVGYMPEGVPHAAVGSYHALL